MINKTYKQEATLEKLKNYYQDQKGLHSVTLARFFEQDLIIEQLAEIKNLNFEMKINHIQHRYSESELDEQFALVFQSKVFRTIIRKITGRSIGKVEGSWLRLGWKQYTILHDEAILDPGIDFIIDLTPQWSDSFGGNVIYVDGKGQSYEIPSKLGSLTVVNREEGFQYYIKYVNHYAQKSYRYLVIAHA